MQSTPFRRRQPPPRMAPPFRRLHVARLALRAAGGERDRDREHRSNAQSTHTHTHKAHTTLSPPLPDPPAAGAKGCGATARVGWPAGPGRACHWADLRWRSPPLGNPVAAPQDRSCVFPAILEASSRRGVSDPITACMGLAVINLSRQKRHGGHARTWTEGKCPCRKRRRKLKWELDPAGDWH